MDEYDLLTEQLREAVRERMSAERLPLERQNDARDLAEARTAEEKMSAAKKEIENEVAELAASFRAAKRKGAWKR